MGALGGDDYFDDQAQTGDGLSPRDVLQSEYRQCVEESSLPRVVILVGEMGVGKTFEVQSFYDHLARSVGGAWVPGLRAAWPPRDEQELDSSRRRVTGLRSDKHDEFGFFWVAGSYAPRRHGVNADSAAEFAAQLAHQLKDAGVAAERRRSLGAAIAHAVVDLSFELLPIPDPIPLVESAVENTIAVVAAAATSTHTGTREWRRAVGTALSRFSKESDRLIPVVAVLDDADVADEHLLSVVSELIGPAPEPGSDRSFLPAQLGDVAPAPALIVCTVRSLELEDDIQTPFARWLRAILRLGLSVRVVHVDGMMRAEAQTLFARWSGDDDGSRRVLDRITRSGRGSEWVNPLALVSSALFLDRRRHPVTRDLDFRPKNIEQLLAIPEQRLVRALDQMLTSGPDGALAHLLLVIAAGCGPVFPGVFLSAFSETVAVTSTSGHLANAISLLVREGFLSASTSPLPLGFDELRIETDVYQYLRAAHLSEPVTRMRTATAERALELLVTELLPNEYGRSKILPFAQWRGSFDGCARWLLTQPADLVSASSQAVAKAIAHPGRVQGGRRRARTERVDARLLSRHALGFAYSNGQYLVGLADDEVVKAVQAYGASRVSSNIAKRALEEMDTTSPHLAELRLTLKALSDHPALAHTLAGDAARRGDAELVEELLDPHLKTSPACARLWADTLADRGDIYGAMQVLSAPGVATNHMVLRQRAKLLEMDGRHSEAIELILAEGDKSFATMRLLARLAVRHLGLDQIRERIVPVIARDGVALVPVAKRFAVDGHEEEAVHLLETAAKVSQSAAICRVGMLADVGRADEAVRDSLDIAHRVFQVAELLIALLRRLDRLDEAIALASAWTERNRKASRILEDLLASQPPGSAGQQIPPALPVGPDRGTEIIALSRDLFALGQTNAALMALGALGTQANLSGRLVALVAGSPEAALILSQLQRYRGPLTVTAHRLTAQLLEPERLTRPQPRTGRERIPLQLAQARERWDRKDFAAALELVRPLLLESQRCGNQYAKWMLFTGDLDRLAEDLVRIAASGEWFPKYPLRDLALRLIRERRRADAVALLHPYLERSLTVTDTYLRIALKDRRFTDALLAIDRVPSVAEWERSCATAIAVLAASGQPGAARRLLRGASHDKVQLSVQTIEVAVDCGRLDVLRLVAGMVPHDRVDSATAAGLLLTIRHSSQRVDNVEQEAARIWADAGARSRAVKALHAHIAAADNASSDREMLAELSRLEVLVALDPASSGLLVGWDPLFKEWARSSVAFRREAARLSKVSPLAKKLATG
ncbi:hypothetical protein [Microbacterium enclense]|uniref:hypothetical protein n=1 Tax=Microbacterium enclense TaxID=993073 RepID=UPI003F7ECF0B